MNPTDANRIRPIVAWWREAQPNSTRGGGDRAALARLRRCATITEAMLEPTTIDLFRRCGARHASELPLYALTTAVLAHVRRDEAIRPARRVGPASTEKPETALLKPGRFRWLIEAATPEERLIAFRRLVTIAAHTLNVGELALALIDWTDERKRRWVFDYWDADPTPVTSEPTKETETP